MKIMSTKQKSKETLETKTAQDMQSNTDCQLKTN